LPILLSKKTTKRGGGGKKLLIRGFIKVPMLRSGFLFLFLVIFEFLIFTSLTLELIPIASFDRKQDQSYFNPMLVEVLGGQNSPVDLEYSSS
jgi:hypothetical protein